MTNTLPRESDDEFGDLPISWEMAEKMAEELDEIFPLDELEDDL